MEIPLSLKCPQCNEPIRLQDRECKNCGVNLALAAGLAVQEFSTWNPAVTAIPITPEILVPRLGEILLEKGILTSEQHQTVIDYHRKQVAEGRRQLFGQAVIELGLVDRDTLDQVVTEQILQLQQALNLTNQQLDRRVQERTADLKNALQKISELNELKSNFISNISHELRTPLTHIRGYLSLLVDGTLGDLNEEQEKAVEVILRSEEKLRQLIEDLIQFSLIARGELSLNIQVVNPKDLVTTSMARAAKLATARGIKLISSISNHLPYIQVDIEKISWVLLQLQDNAIKFSPFGGWVKVEATYVRDFVTLAVSDNGIGIDPERMEELFQPFHQLDGSSTRHYGGTGLGLALVRRIVEAHGSTIHVQSSVGKGSRFEFSVPAVEKTNA
jgi:signal transduction histidine kinase